MGDPASHAFRGPTKRNAAMFGRHAHAYVYRIHQQVCLNVTSEAEGAGAAVLIRALEPLEGIEAMHARRAAVAGRPVPGRDLARGPGRLTQALAIDLGCDGRDLDADPELWLADDGVTLSLGVSRRIGISRAAERPLRFYARGSPWVSGPRALSP